MAVDFEKRELKDTQQNSDNDKQSFYRNKTKICNDAVTIFQTAKSGGIWHMRAFVGDADKYFQKSLRSCLLAYDLSQQGMDALEIGIQVRNIDVAEADDLVEDGRSRSRQYDIAKLQSAATRDVKRYWEVYDRIIGGLKKKNEKEKAFWAKVHKEQMEKDKPKKRTREELLNNVGEFDSRFGYDRVGNRTKIDYLRNERIEEAMLKEGYRKSHYERTQRKNSIRTNTYKLLNKAQANIEAIERGTFALGHWHS